MRFLSALLCFVSISLAADSDDYVPFGQGHEWTMDAAFTSPEGEVTHGTAHRRVGEKEERNGQVYYRTRIWMENAPFPVDHTDLRRRDRSGSYSLDLKDANAKEQPGVMLPLEAGKRWSVAAGQVTFKNEVLGIEDVIVNGTKYEKCYRIRTASTDGGYTEDYWEAPKVGCVKHEIVFQNGVKISMTLREFKPGKK